MEHEAYPYKGQVKEVREYHIMMRNDEELQDTDYYFHTYSADGHLVADYINNVDMLCDNRYYWSNSRLDSIVYDGDCYSFRYYLYDSADRLTQVVTSIYGRDDLDTMTIIYDQRGFPVALVSDNNEPWFEWHDDGRLKGRGSKYWQEWYEYDSQGRVIKENKDDTYETTYTYNSQGDLIREAVRCLKPSYCNGGWTTTTTYTYRHDARGNWTEMYQGGELKVIRKITYYD